MQKSKDVEVSVPFHSDTVETSVELVSLCPTVCQFVPYAMSHFYCYHKKQAFRPQSRQVGVKIPRQVCQGGRGSIC